MTFEIYGVCLKVTNDSAGPTRRRLEGRKGTQESVTDRVTGAQMKDAGGDHCRHGEAVVSFIFFLQQLKNGKQMLWGDLVFLGN